MAIPKNSGIQRPKHTEVAAITGWVFTNKESLQDRTYKQVRAMIFDAFPAYKSRPFDAVIVTACETAGIKLKVPAKQITPNAERERRYRTLARAVVVLDKALSELLEKPVLAEDLRAAVESMGAGYVKQPE